MHECACRSGCRLPLTRPPPSNASPPPPHTPRRLQRCRRRPQRCRRRQSLSSTAVQVGPLALAHAHGCPQAHTSRNVLAYLRLHAKRPRSHFPHATRRISARKFVTVRAPPPLRTRAHTYSRARSLP
eukprot:6203968-Pleurochrysis_carterae.AAC.1